MAVMELFDLTTEYQKEPVGLGVKKPRFSWKIAAKEGNTVQTGYRILIKDWEKTAWDSGIVASDRSVLVPYEGNDLKEETEYQVQVTVWDNHGNQARLETHFETGIFDGEKLKAVMITHDFPQEEQACPIFYKEFLLQKSVEELEKAYIYGTAHGVYEFYLNEKRVGEDRMTPGWTSYHHRLEYQCYDVTQLLKQKNRIEMTVANGWYKGIMGFDCKPNRYGDRVEALAELHILYRDGSRQCVGTDETWGVRTGELRYSEIYMGEVQDTTFTGGREGRVSNVFFDKSKLTPQENEPVRITERRKPIKYFVDPAGNRVLDFGQNLTGVVELHIKGNKGQKVKLRHGETLDAEGKFYMANLRQAKAEDTFILNGKEQTLLPHFTFHGFRYVAVEGLSNERMAHWQECFCACVMHSDMEKIGDFWCSDEKVNRLQKNIAWSLRDNFLDIPTDCPQRDERLGWMGDAQVFSWTAAFNRNTARFFTKWMRDVAAESSLEKGVPHVVPDIVGSYSSSAWSDAAVIIPWVVYQSYGDERILEECWKCMHEWVDYITERANENGLWMSGYQYGDWLALDREQGDGSVGATDVYLVANAYYSCIADIVSKTAQILGKEEESKYYHKLHERIVDSFQKEYYTERGRIVSETQTGCVLSLYFDLARKKDREGILRRLVENIEKHKTHLTTGFVGTPYLCHALSDNGAHDMASALFLKEDYPSWLYAVNQGATTIWERWNAVHEDGTMEHPGLNSMNHYANGAIGDWMYRKIGGINQIEPGYHRFYIKPLFVQGIEEAKVSLKTPYGEILSAWECRNGKISVKVSIPANTTALLHLPEKEEAVELGSGDYAYEYGTHTSLRKLRFTMDSTLGDLMAEPQGLKMLTEMVPELVNNPMIEYAKRMTLAEGGEIKAVYQKILKVLNA